MSYVKEKVSYLRGLYDGLNIENDAQGKLIGAIIEAMDSIADAIDDNEATIDELDECISDIYDALEEMEEDLYDLFDDLEDLEELDDDLFEDSFVEVTCPHCHDVIYFDQEMLSSKDDLICPSCNKKLPLGEDRQED